MTRKDNKSFAYLRGSLYTSADVKLNPGPWLRKKEKGLNPRKRHGSPPSSELSAPWTDGAHSWSYRC